MTARAVGDGPILSALATSRTVAGAQSAARRVEQAGFERVPARSRPGSARTRWAWTSAGELFRLEVVGPAMWSPCMIRLASSSIIEPSTSCGLPAAGPQPSVACQATR